MAKWLKGMKALFQAKRKTRKELSQLPIEKKFEVLLQLQKISDSVLKSRDYKKVHADSKRLDQIVQFHLPVFDQGWDQQSPFSALSSANFDNSNLNFSPQSRKGFA